jgi:hypothetical protein
VIYINIGCKLIANNDITTTTTAFSFLFAVIFQSSMLSLAEKQRTMNLAKT